MVMKKGKFALAVLLVTLMSLFACSAVHSADIAERYRFTAQEAGTAILIYTTAVTEIVKPYLPAATNIDILPTGAVVASCTMVNDGLAEVGWGEASAKWSVEGAVLYGKKHENLRSVAGGFVYVYLQAFANKNFIEKNKITSFEDIKTKKLPVRIMTKTKGTMGAAAAPLQLEAYGITYDDIKAWGGSITETGVPDIVDAMKDNRADLWLDNLAPGHPAATELFQLAEIKIIEHSPEGLKFLEKYGFSSAVTPAGTWKGQEKDIKQPQGCTLMTTSIKVSEDFVYLLTKAICENADTLRAAHATLKKFDEKTAWNPEKLNFVPLHPGAEKYYKEKGWLK